MADMSDSSTAPSEERDALHSSPKERIMLLSLPKKCTESWNVCFFFFSSCENPFLRPRMWVNAPGLAHTPKSYQSIKCMWSSPWPLWHTQTLIRTGPCLLPVSSQRRWGFTISSGSVFHPTGSRACWPTAPRWRPRTPSWRRLYSLASPAPTCRKGDGDTSDTCPSVYCSLKRDARKHQHQPSVSS